MHSYKNYRTNKNEPDGSLRMRDFVAVGGFGQGGAGKLTIIFLLTNVYNNPVAILALHNV